MTDSKRPMIKCLIVLGAHRSGTSALMGALYRMGVWLGSRYIVDHYENSEIVDLNNELLDTLGSSWDDVFALPDQWWLDERLSVFKDRGMHLLEREFGAHALWGIKDPRICILLPFWTELLNHLGVAPIMIIPLRDPFEVVGSHGQRDSFGSEKSLLLWLNQVLSAELYSRGYKRCFCRFGDILKEPTIALTRFCEQLGIDFPRPMQQALNDVTQFIKPGLRHHRNSAGRQSLSSYPRPLQTLYQFLFTGPISLEKISQSQEVWDTCRREYRQLQRFFLNATLRADWMNLRDENFVFLKRLVASGMDMIRMRQHDYAIRHFNALTEILPEHRGLWNNLGIAYEQKGDLKRALGCFKRAVELSPGYQLAVDNYTRVSKKISTKTGCHKTDSLDRLTKENKNEISGVGRSPTPTLSCTG